MAMVGGFERERGHISEESFVKLCLGLESKLGRPMLATVFSEGAEALWEELLSNESRVRQEKGWEIADYATSSPSLEDLDKAFDSASAEVKKCALLWYRALDGRTKGWEGWGSPSRRSDAPREAPGRGAGRVRVRKIDRKRT